ncbi:MAG: DEAD/DEAH box helicase [Ignavibacteria bacterium]|nr:DEAD/DEAH box helicase [Ignavibacteria bacterium]
MYKTIRKKVASTVSEIERTEDFAWGKWLKEPALSEHTIEGFQTSLLDTNQYNSWLEKPEFQKKKFDFRETFVFPESKNLHPKKFKTHTVFFGLAKTEVKKLKLFDRQFKFEHKPEKVEFRSISVKLKDIKWNLSPTKVEEKPWELKPYILKIDLLEPDNLVLNKYAGKESKVEFKVVKAPPKIYKVKITGLDKIKLAKIYYLKNISLHDVRILRDSYNLLTKPAVQQEDLKYFVTEEEKKTEVLQEETIVEETKPVEEIKHVDTEESEGIYNEFINKSIDQQMSEILSGDFNPVELVKEDQIQQETKPEETLEAPVSNEDIYNHEKEKIIEEPEEAEPEEVEEPDEADENEHENEFESLYYFQESGAEFLLDGKRALLSDEMGMGKTIQVIAALKNHFAGKKIKSAVIVCESTEIGSWGKITGDVDGWLGHFHQRAPELKVEAGDGTPQERSKQWKELPDVLILSYDSFFFDLEENIINSKELKKINCFIFDEVHNLFNHKNYNTQKLSKAINSKYLWALTSYPEEAVKEKLEKVFKEKLSIKNYLGRSRKEVAGDLRGITWQNKWLTLDEEQVEDYNEAFATAKEKVQWFLESGNPLRFNANVFTLLHQLKQVCNFSEKKGKSRKTKILLEHVNRIEKNNQKVVIFSQYDKAGTKKIEEVLNKNNIKFLSYAPGMSTKEMETVLKNFSSPAGSGVTALVSGIKPSRVKIPSGNISYVIHFDLWWNPASLWQTEEAVIGSSNGEKQNLNVYSYLMKGTVEERIHSLLYKKGFLNKHVMETVNPDSIAEMLTNPEWLEIFDMPDEEYKQRYQKGLLETERRIDNYSINEFMERGKNFFAKLGYKNLDAAENKNGDSFDIRGIFKKAKFDQQMSARFLLKETVNEDEVKAHLAELKVKSSNGKFFLITKGTFEGDKVIRPNEALIDRRLLINYFYQFIVI